MNVAESGSAGRARSATTETKNARAKVLFRERPLPEPVDDPDLLDWTNPGTRIRLINALMADPGPFSFLRRRAVAVLEVLINRRNPHTGQLDPSWLNLGAGARYKDRSVAYALSELRRHGLIASVRRCYGLRPTSCAYVLTCTLLVLAGLVKEHDPGTCAKCRSAAALNAGPRLHNLQTNRDLLFPSGISSSADPTRSKKGRGEPRRVRAGIRPPFSMGSGAEESSDPTLTAFLAVFQRERRALYDDNDHGSLGSENRAKLSAFLADFVGGACAWSEQQGLDRERQLVAEELFEGLARTWLSMPGTRGFVRERRHPIGLLVGDLHEFGELARHAWERKQAKPKPLEEHQAPAGAVSAASYVEQLQAQEPEEWPDLDDSEPDPDELAELDAIRVAAAQVRATIEPSIASVAEPPPGDRFLLASIHAAMESRAALAASKDAANVQSAKAFPESIRKTTYVEPPPCPVRLTDAAPEPTVVAPRTHRERTEVTEGPTTGPEAAEGLRPTRVRRPASRPFAGTTSATGGRPDAWRPLARPMPRTGDEPPDE